MPRILIAFAIWWYVCGIATQYGGVWDSQVNPHQGVTVRLSGGDTVTGSLYRDWNLGWRLEVPDGRSLTFKDFEEMQFTTPGQEAHVSFAAHWRSWLPLVLVTHLFFIAAAWPLVLKLLPRKFRRALARQ